MTRIRIRFAKAGKVRFTSHRDVARIWERTLRRADVRTAYSEGFSPRPKLHFGLALSTGHESDAEYLDVDLAPGVEVDLVTLPTRLTAALPRGISATAAAVVGPGTTSLQHAVTSSTWDIEVEGLDETSLLAAAARLIAAPELVMTRQRKGKDVTDDVRPYIRTLDMLGPIPDGSPVGGTVLRAEIGTQPRGLRPSELVSLLGEGAAEGRVRRIEQWTEHDGARQAPLAAPTTSAPHAEVRVS